jgi:hypothetical protein
MISENTVESRLTELYPSIKTPPASPPVTPEIEELWIVTVRQFRHMSTAAQFRGAATSCTLVLAIRRLLKSTPYITSMPKCSITLSIIRTSASFAVIKAWSARPDTCLIAAFRMRVEVKLSFPLSVIDMIDAVSVLNAVKSLSHIANEEPEARKKTSRLHSTLLIVDEWIRTVLAI